MQKIFLARNLRLAIGTRTFFIPGLGQQRHAPPPAAKGFTSRDVGVTPLSLILVRHDGDSATDEQIRRFQEHVSAGRDRKNSLEHLGWLFVKKARESFDTGYYKLAEACADVMNADSPDCAEA